MCFHPCQLRLLVLDRPEMREKYPELQLAMEETRDFDWAEEVMAEKRFILI